MSAATLMVFAMAIEITLGWPSWLYQLIRHPVVWLGALINRLEQYFNRPRYSQVLRRSFGVLSLAVVLGATLAITSYLTYSLPNNGWGMTAEVLIASSLLATRSLYEHVAAVKSALMTQNLGSARVAVAHIVGRDPAELDSAGICRASIESLAENASDGVLAPLFWGAIFGLPGIAGYKAINTLDSMIGHRTDRYEAFGWASAKLDDVVNWIPARLMAILFAFASLRMRALQVTMSDARSQRSPNAGWPESALAGALNVRLSGPRVYAGEQDDTPWINEHCADPNIRDLSRALHIYVIAMCLVFASLVAMALFGLSN